MFLLKVFTRTRPASPSFMMTTTLKPSGYERSKHGSYYKGGTTSHKRHILVYKERKMGFEDEEFGEKETFDGVLR
ncbi:hypothetical protein L484_020874 [Morus notabilis]|uniref:Uncharacterized protein n=1 Tax=Morus notabilis TaxID=981085 RepID=W9QP34_9ROSA|nr:hypothetical protein L484_020874 [Morus notabilis]